MVDTAELEEMLEENERRLSQIKSILDEEKKNEEKERQKKEHEKNRFDSEPELDGVYMSRYRDIMDRHRDILVRHEEFVDNNTELLKEVATSYDRVVHDFRAGTIKNLEDYETFLDEISEEKQSQSVGYIMKGLGLLGAGIASAAYYSSNYMTSITDFYAQSPEIYIEEPEIAFFTLGLPAAGVYMLKKSYDRSNEHQKFRKKKREVKGELDDIYNQP